MGMALEFKGEFVQARMHLDRAINSTILPHIVRWRHYLAKTTRWQP